MTKRQLLETWK